ncbi:MAG: hypothetical protein Q9195_007826 [Heterodermia aff. obscurata]
MESAPVWPTMPELALLEKLEGNKMNLFKILILINTVTFIFLGVFAALTFLIKGVPIGSSAGNNISINVRPDACQHAPPGGPSTTKSLSPDVDKGHRAGPRRPTDFPARETVFGKPAWPSQRRGDDYQYMTGFGPGLDLQMAPAPQSFPTGSRPHFPRGPSVPETTRSTQRSRRASPAPVTRSAEPSSAEDSSSDSSSSDDSSSEDSSSDSSEIKKASRSKKGHRSKKVVQPKELASRKRSPREEGSRSKKDSQPREGPRSKNSTLPRRSLRKESSPSKRASSSERYQPHRPSNPRRSRLQPTVESAPSSREGSPQVESSRNAEHADTAGRSRTEDLQLVERSPRPKRSHRDSPGPSKRARRARHGKNRQIDSDE